MQKWYYINASMDKVGPVTQQALKVLVENGLIGRRTALIAEDGTHMIEAEKIPGLFPPAPAPTVSVPPSIMPPISGPTSHIPNDPWKSYEHFQADPFATVSQQGPFDRTQAPTVSSELSGIFLGVVLGLGAILLCILGFGLATMLTKEPIKTAEKPVSVKHADKTAEEIENNSIDEATKRQQLLSPVVDDKVEFPPAPPVKIPNKLTRSTTSGPRPKPVTSTPRPDVSRPNPQTHISPPSVAVAPPTTTPAAISVVSANREPVIPKPVRKQRYGKRDTEEIVAEIEGSVALINGKMGSGSGFVVLPGILATNSHVINSEKIDEIEVLFPSETGAKKGPFKAQLLYEDLQRDLAFLEIPVKEHAPLQTVEDYRFRRGQRIIAIGNPGRGDGQVLENAVSEGILSTQTEVEEQPYYQLSISINTGNSGGPVLNDEGDVLGVVTLKGTKTEGVAFCIPPDALNEAIMTVRRSDSTFIDEIRRRHEKRVPLHRGIDKMSLLQQVPQSKLRDFAQDTVKEFEEAIRQTPEEADAYLGRGVCRALMGDVDGTVSDFESAARLAPNREELVELRDTVRRERERLRRELAGPGGSGHVLPLDRLQRFRPGMGGNRSDSGGPTMSPEESLMRENRYQQILQKDQWMFNGKPLRGRLIGYEDGIAHFKPADDENGEVVKRYANRFSRQDIADIIFYAQYHRIPLGNLRTK